MITFIIGGSAIIYGYESEIGFFLRLITVVLCVICDTLILRDFKK